MKVKLWRRVFAASMSAAMLLGLTACGGSDSTESSESSDGIKTFTMFIAMPGSEINDDNEIMNIIAEKTGAKLKETWLTGQTDAEAIGTIIAGGEYPDFINGGDAMMSLYDAGVLVPWDDYLEKYPNLKELYTDEEWDSFRQDDGKIYWANVFQNTYGEDRSTTHNDEAFWIQARVLEWAGYPEIETLDQYSICWKAMPMPTPPWQTVPRTFPTRHFAKTGAISASRMHPSSLMGIPTTVLSL